MVDQAKADAFGKELGFTGYGGEFMVGDHKMVMTTDGVGTKLLIAEALGIYDTVGVDLVMMCANDLICCGAQPLTFMDYYATGDLDLDKSHEIMSGILTGCMLADCKLTGGETAQLKPMFLEDSWFDLAGFMVGEVISEFDQEPIKSGDYLVGIPSSGLHSNGFTRLRERWVADYEPWMLTPTRCYVEEVMDNMNAIKACAHITGGGIRGNLNRILPDNNYDLDYNFDIFWLRMMDILDLDFGPMLDNYNCGYGMIVITSNPRDLDMCDARIIGRVT